MNDKEIRRWCCKNRYCHLTQLEKRQIRNGDIWLLSPWAILIRKRYERRFK
jgi:hypothetical protein